MSTIEAGSEIPITGPDHQQFSTLDAELTRLFDGTDSEPDVYALPVSTSPTVTPLVYASFLGRLLRRLRADTDDLAIIDEIEAADSWDFIHNGTAFFLALLAPCYPEAHPRSFGSSNVAVLLFQPERAFRRRGISSRSPHRNQLSDAVRIRFARSGRRYDASLGRAVPKVLRYVKPVDLQDTPIAWWQARYLD
jgi:hypothetical protein